MSERKQITDLSGALVTPSKSERKLLRTGLLIAGSALFGGLAVALWNRRALTQLRREVPDSEINPPVEKDAIY